jgi:hypothetical protein
VVVFRFVGGRWLRIQVNREVVRVVIGCVSLRLAVGGLFDTSVLRLVSFGPICAGLRAAPVPFRDDWPDWLARALCVVARHATDHSVGAFASAVFPAS